MLPDPPAWLNIDKLMSYDDRQRLKDLIEEGRELLPSLAEWAVRVRDAMARYDQELPEAVWEVEEIQVVLGLRALNDVMMVIGVVGANPAGTPDFHKLADLREKYPQYGEMLR